MTKVLHFARIPECKISGASSSVMVSICNIIKVLCLATHIYQYKVAEVPHSTRTRAAFLDAVFLKCCIPRMQEHERVMFAMVFECDITEVASFPKPY